MLLLLLLVPIIGVFIISAGRSCDLEGFNPEHVKKIALTTFILNFLLSLIIFILFDFSSNLFQFVQEYHEISSYGFYLGVDGLSIYFVLLITMIMPIVLLSNWKSIGENVRSYVIIILLLETLLLAVFLVLDILLFYIFFEYILLPLFLLIGLYSLSSTPKAHSFVTLSLQSDIMTILTVTIFVASVAANFTTSAYVNTDPNGFVGVFELWGMLPPN